MLQRASEPRTRSRHLPLGHEVAGQGRMLERMQLDHERVCTHARDRNVYLADRLGEIEAITADDIGRATSVRGTSDGCS
jgi:hypothetical protein